MNVVKSGGFGKNRFTWGGFFLEGANLSHTMMQIISTEFCLHKVMLLDTVKNLEGNRRKMILERMSWKRFVIEFITS